MTLLGEWEHPWIEAVLELNNALGVFLLCKTSRSKIIETLVDREYLSALSNEEAKRIVSRLIHAFPGNLDEIEDRENMSGGMIAFRIFWSGLCRGVRRKIRERRY